MNGTLTSLEEHIRRDISRLQLELTVVKSSIGERAACSPAPPLCLPAIPTVTVSPQFSSPSLQPVKHTSSLWTPRTRETLSKSFITSSSSMKPPKLTTDRSSVDEDSGRMKLYRLSRKKAGIPVPMHTGTPKWGSRVVSSVSSDFCGNCLHCQDQLTVVGQHSTAVTPSGGDTDSYEDIACLGESTTLSEVSLDGNPMAQDSHYKQTVLRYMSQLRQLDMKRVTDDERRIAAVMARKEDEKKKESSKITAMKEKRRLAINNAKRQWEVNQGSLMAKSNRLVRGIMPEIHANHVGNIANSELILEDEQESSRASSRLSRPASAKSAVSEKDWPGTISTNLRPPSASTTNSSIPDITSVISDKVTSSVSSAQFLSEIEGDTLNLYGSGALEGLDRNWGIQAAGSVTTVCFRFVDFDDIAKVLHKIRVRFPNVHTLTFNATNITQLHQLNALAQVRRLDHLNIDTEGNPVTQYSLWRTYALFRLAHFCLKKINNIDVSAADIVNAEKFFGTLAHITTSQLPQSRLLALIGEKKKQTLSDDRNKKPGGDNYKLTDRNESVGRAGLVYSPPDVATAKAQEQLARQSFVNGYLTTLTKDAINVDQKMSALHQSWPAILTDLVRAAVVDMWDMTAYTRKCLEEVDS